MAHHQEVDYSSEEVRSVASPGGGGVPQYVVKETFEEVDQVSRAGGRGHGHRHGNRGQHGHFEARETKLEEDVNTGTGEFHERKENFVVRAD